MNIIVNGENPDSGILRAAACCEFEGAVDDVRIFNYELSPEELAEVCAGGAPSCCPEEGDLDFADTRCLGLEVTGDGSPGEYVHYAATKAAVEALTCTPSSSRE